MNKNKDQLQYRSLGLSYIVICFYRHGAVVLPIILPRGFDWGVRRNIGIRRTKSISG